MYVLVFVNSFLPDRSGVCYHHGLVLGVCVLQHVECLGHLLPVCLHVPRPALDTLQQHLEHPWYEHYRGSQRPYIIETTHSYSLPM